MFKNFLIENTSISHSVDIHHNTIFMHSELANCTSPRSRQSNKKKF